MADLLGEAGQTAADFLKILLDPSYAAGLDLIPEYLRKGKKRSQRQLITRSNPPLLSGQWIEITSGGCSTSELDAVF